MSQLTLYSQFNMRKPYLVSHDSKEVSAQLAQDGVRYEKWSVDGLSRADKNEVLRELREPISKVQQEFNAPIVDIVGILADENRSLSLRDKSLSEHTHREPEIRLFLHGRALVYIHVNQRIHILNCEAGDFIVIPAGTKHWMDMGPKPDFRCVRWFDSIDNLRNEFTGSYIAESTPRWETMLCD